MTCGATYCILYAYDTTIASISGADQIPSLFVNHQAGLEIISAIESGAKPVITVHAEIEKYFPISTAGTVSETSFSEFE
jgi:hypothetical protein